MASTPRITLSAVTLDAPDVGALAAFYRDLLGWDVSTEAPDWVTLRPAGGGTGISIQKESAYVRPTWPTRPGDQQMMVHLDIEVADLEAAGSAASAAGATLADYQPQANVRVYLDPAGHPFCLFLPE